MLWSAKLWSAKLLNRSSMASEDEMAVVKRCGS